MSFKRNIARAAITAGLTVSMALGGIAPATVAWAEGVTYGTGKFEIACAEGNDTSFYAWRIFKANVKDDATSATGKSESNIEWADADVSGGASELKDYVEAVIKAEDSTYKGTTAQDAADWIQAHVTGTDSTTRVGADSVANKLARAVQKADEDGILRVTKFDADSEETLAEGYWLIVTDPATIGDGESGTAPIFAVIGGNKVTMTEKTSVPTSEKDIKSDATGAWGQVADSHVGQAVSYKITGTVADNVDTYSTYKYVFHDNVSKGLTVDLNSVKVKVYASADEAKTDLDGATDTIGTTIDAVKYTKSLAAAVAGDGSNDLTVSFTDLKKSGATIDKDSVVVVYYTATINDQAVMGDTGNPNTAYIEYSNNPNSDGTGKTTPNTPKDYTYQLKLVKVDRNTEKTLAGAKFTIQATDPDDTDSTGKYVQADGKLGADKYEFTTGEDGTISLKGLDAGTYTVTETAAPDGYTAVKPFTFTVSPSYKDDGSIDALTNTVTSTDAVAGEADGKKGDNKLTAKDGTASDATTGLVTVTVGDAKQVGLPLTGQSGLMLTVLVGGAVVAVSAVALAKRNKEDDAE
jgi:LPXTG-motif cell wall-anchored protein